MLQGCGYSGEMVALASRDADVSQFFGLPDKPITFRKEILLPVSSGKNLNQGEDFIEVWRDNTKAGWVYYFIKAPLIRRIGYQRDGESFVESPGQMVDLQTVDTSRGKTTIFDGKEVK